MFANLIDRVLVVSGAIVMTQVPLFFQQYMQRLSGHLSELELQITLLRQTAARSGKSFHAYIDKFLNHSDSDFRAQGEFMQGMLQRLDDLKLAFNKLSDSSAWMHPFYLLRYGDSEIASSTLSGFEPGLSFTLESLVYALIGMILGFGIFKGVRWVIGAVRSLFVRGHGAVINSH